MPSGPAQAIIREVTQACKKELTPDEILSCEELAINNYSNAVARYVHYQQRGRKGKRGIKFSHLYAPIFNGVVVGAKRRIGADRFKFENKTSREIYAVMHRYLGSGFSMKELDAIVWLSQNSNKQEVLKAINVASYYGVVHGCYVKAVIERNRRKAGAQLRLKNSKYKKVVDDKPMKQMGVPNVKDIQDNWTRKLKRAVNDKESDQASDFARGKIQI